MPKTERKPLVLCVDDEPSILSSLRRVFLDEPWDLRFAGSGAEGLELIERHGADVVLSDYRMPGMNGVEFLKKVKEIHPDCVRVVLSGYADVATILSALNEGEIYRFLGLEVGCIVHGLQDAERKAAYAADVTYGTNNEFGFDYLRDNMKFSLEEMVQREFNYAIVDEVDSILIDEARTPLIISGAAEDSSDLYKKVDKVIPRLEAEH